MVSNESNNQPKEAKVAEADVKLVAGNGTKRSSGGLSGHYWHIYVGDVRVGRVFIKLHKEHALRPYASITVEINQSARGRGIGSIAYKLACEASPYSVVFAIMRKGNVASRIAAERAGFQAVENWSGRELRLVWKRS